MMKQQELINQLRFSARKLVRELGLLTLNASSTHRPPQSWHTLIEVCHEPNITMSQLSNLLLIPVSNMSRIVSELIKDELITVQESSDKREKKLIITPKGTLELGKINEFSNKKIIGALDYLTEQDATTIIDSLNRYGNALEKSRLLRDQISMHTLSTSRLIRKQIIAFVETIQKDEFNIPIQKEMNECIMKAENEFYFKNSYNFWYASDADGNIIGCVGLNRIDGKNAEIKKFFVHSSYRGKNVAQKLMNTLVKSALKHGIKQLYLGTVSHLERAQRFYEKYEFTKIKEFDLPKAFNKCPLDTVFYKIKTDTLQKNIQPDLAI